MATVPYYPRSCDNVLNRQLQLTGATLVVEPKWCGKTEAALQAAAMGLPSIVTDINGCNEIIQNGHNGLVIPPKKSKALEQAMSRLMEDKALTSKLASNARGSIVSRYDQQTIWKLIKAEYDDHLEQCGLL